MLNYELPVNRTDALAFIHDLEYMRYGTNSKYIETVDKHAAIESPISNEGIAMRTGLWARSQLDLNISPNSDSEMFFKALRFVHNDPTWTSVLSKYDVHFTHEHVGPL